MGRPLFKTSLRLAPVLAIIFATLIQDIHGGRNGAGSQQQQSPADFDCPEEFGYYAHPTDCTLYYVCVFGGALLESCTGGLMYSHELQTCDWPRNVGCAPGQQQQISQPQQQHITQKVAQQPVSQQVDTASSSRGRQRQQQIQIPKADLYTEEEDLGPAEEIESDRQQRVYRGQPSTLGQVASDRDGLNTHSNAIPVPSSGGRDKLSVVSYGAQQQYNRASVQPVQQQVYDPRGYNSTRYIQQQQQYDPNYYSVYDEEAEQYKDIADYAQYVQQNKQEIYTRKKPSVEIVQQEPVQRGSPYTKNKYSNQQENIYQSVTPQEYDSYSIQTNDDIPYRQVQTKSNNRYPEVKESGSTQGERRLYTLSAKYPEGYRQTDTKTDTDFGGSRSDAVVTETNVVNITPRKSDRTSGEQAKSSGRNPSFAQQINALAQGEDPVAKVLEALSKSEEYVSDEASTERNSDSRSSRGESGEVGKSITVEELDIEFLKNLNSRSREDRANGGFRNTNQNQQKPFDSNEYRMGVIQVQTTPDPRQGLTPNQQDRQGKIVQEITTPKPLIVRLPEAFSPRTQAFETGPLLSRARQDPIRIRGSANHQEYEDEQNRRGTDDRASEQRRNNINSGNPETRVNEYRGHYDLRQQVNENNQPQRSQLGVTPRTTYTASPIRISVEPIRNEDSLRETILKEYNHRIEESRRRQPESFSPSRNSNEQLPAVDSQTDARSPAIPESLEDPNKHLLIRIPDNSQTAQIKPRQKLKPLSDYVNSNVNTMIEDVNGRKTGDSLESFGSGEEQTSDEARKPIAIRVPDSGRRNEDSINRGKYEQSEEDYSRKPIRYVDSLEYKERTGYRRGSSRYMPSTAEEYDEEELTNVTDEPRRPIAVRKLERTESVRDHSNSGDGSYRNVQEEERRRIVVPQSPKQIKQEPVRPVAIKVPDSVDLNQYRSREHSPAARVVESLTPSRERQRTAEEDVRHQKEQRTRISTANKEVGREELRKRYEVPTTLRPTRVLSLPTTSKPTRPPKKFRNATLYSDQTLPFGTDTTENNSPPEPDTSIRVRPMSFNVPTSPGLTRGNLRHRGSLTYTVSPNEAEPPSQPRGTPPPQRGRPTLKPSTTVVGKAAEYVDIYRYPARRPENVYPTPQVDKTAAKCRKDVCLLPDCYCGGKDIPGELTPEETPQIVLLTFDDSVNDLNKGLYSDLFDKGRVNPNGCPIGATFYVSHEWTDYSQVQNLYAGGHEIASHSVSHSFGEQFSQKKWTREIAGQREILAAYGGVKLEDIRGMRAPFLAVGGNKMFKMLYDSNFTYDSSMPVYENRPPSWPYTLDYKVFHDCMIPPCPTKSYPGVWEVPMVMWQDLNGGRCSMGDACSNPPTSDGVYKMLIKNFERHFTTNRAPFGLFYHAAWFTQPHHKEGFIAFLDTINKMPEVWLITNWQAVQWVRDPTPLSRLGNFAPFQCNYPDRPKKCNNPKVCNLWHKSGVRYMRTCQACPDIYPWTGKSGVRNSRVDNDLE